MTLGMGRLLDRAPSDSPRHGRNSAARPVRSRQLRQITLHLRLHLHPVCVYICMLPSVGTFCAICVAPRYGLARTWFSNTREQVLRTGAIANQDPRCNLFATSMLQCR